MLRTLPELMYNISVSPTDPNLIRAKNLWRRGEVLNQWKTSMSIFTEHTVRNGEKPEDLALKYYNNSFYNWTILVINDIVNVYDAKYDNPMATKHYVTIEVKDTNENIICPAGKIVPSNFQISYFDGSTTITANPVVSITNYQYEADLNAEKEKIQMIRPSYIEQFVEVYQNRQRQGGSISVGNSYSGLTMD